MICKKCQHEMSSIGTLYFTELEANLLFWCENCGTLLNQILDSNSNVKYIWRETK